MSARKRKRVRWLWAALDDVEQIYAYIARDSPAAAQRVVDAIFERAKWLADLPYLGGVCPYSRKIRQLIYRKYIIYYSVHRQEVVIRAVVHGARLFRRAWLNRE